jgi:hypothetical protein
LEERILSFDPDSPVSLTLDLFKIVSPEGQSVNDRGGAVQRRMARLPRPLNKHMAAGVTRQILRQSADMHRNVGLTVVFDRL